MILLALLLLQLPNSPAHADDGWAQPAQPAEPVPPAAEAPLDPAEYAGRVCVNNHDENFCRVCNIFFEAGVEPYLGKLAVGGAIEERISRGTWGTSACAVIWARQQFSWTFLKQSRRLPPVSNRNFIESVRAAEESKRLGPNGVTHYYNPSLVSPAWGHSCRKAPVHAQYTQKELGHQVYLSCGPRLTVAANLVQGELTLRERQEAEMTSGSYLLHDENGNVVGTAIGE